MRAEGIDKTYVSGLVFRKRHQVLRNVSLKIEEGRTLGLMGPSGCGKTTLGMILAGLLNPSAGRILYHEKDIRNLKGEELRAYRRGVQMVFQDPEGSLNPRKSIERSIHEVLRLLKTPEKEWRSRTLEALEGVGLSEELLCRYPSQISGGQGQRVALSRVLLLNPRVLILDEPTSALDISVQAQILGLLKDLHRERGLSYLLISHQPEVVRFMSHETAIL